MKHCAICGNETGSGVVVDAKCLTALKRENEGLKADNLRLQGQLIRVLRDKESHYKYAYTSGGAKESEEVNHG